MKFALLAAAMLLAFASLLPRAAFAADPVEITVNVSLTGQGAFLGKGQRQTLQAIEEMTNKQGGINGRPLRFVFADDQTSPPIAVGLMNETIAKKTPVVIGPSFTATCLAVAPLVAAAGPVSYCLSPAIHPTQGSYMFAITASLYNDLAVLVRYFRLRGWTRIGLITSNDATGQDVERGINLALSDPANRTMKLVESDRFGLADISVAAQMSRLKAAQPDAIIAWTTGTPWGTLLHGINDAGIDVPIAGSAGNALYPQMAQLANILPPKLLFAGLGGMVRGAARPGPVRSAQDTYFAAFDAIGVRPDFGNLVVWDAVMIVVDALKHLGPTATATQIRDYIEHLHGWVGAQGIYDFGDREQRGVGENAVEIVGWDTAKKDWVALSRPGGYLK